MRRSLIVVLVVGLLGIGITAAGAQTALSDSPNAPDIGVLLDDVGWKLDHITKIAEELQNRPLYTEVQRLREALQETIRLYHAGNVDDARQRAARIAEAVRRLFERTAPLSSVEPSATPDDLTAYIRQALDLLARVRAEAERRNDAALIARLDELNEMIQALLLNGGAFPDGTLLRLDWIMDVIREIAVRLQPRPGDGTRPDMPDPPRPWPGGPTIPPDGSRPIMPPIVAPDSAQIAEGLAKAEAVIDSISAILVAEPNAEAQRYLDRAVELTDSVEAHLLAGELRRAAVELQRVHGFVARTLTILHLETHVETGLARARAAIDSLRQVLAADPIPEATAALDRAEALADTVQARLDADEIWRAEIALGRLRAVIAKVHEIIHMKAWVAASLEKAEAIADSLAARLENTPNPRAEGLLGHVPALLDSAQARLDEGRILAAGAAMRRVFHLFREVHEAFRMQSEAARALEAFENRLARADSIITDESDSTAIALYAKAVEAADSAATNLAGGRYRAALNWIKRGNEALEHALFIVTAPERAERELGALRERIRELAASLPEDAHRERGIVRRASELADSARAALDRGEVHHALDLVQKTGAALTQLMRDPRRLPPGPMPMPFPTPGPDGQMPSLDDVIEQARQWIGQAISLLDSSLSDSARAKVNEALAIVNQIPLAIASGQMDLAVELAIKAYAVGMEAVNLIRNENLLPTDADPVMEDLFNAGEEAARLAGEPTAVNGASAAPTRFALSNSPNPFNPSTTIHFSLTEAAPVRLTIYNMLGQEVRLLVNDTRPAGVYAFTWNGAGDSGIEMASGIYFARLVAGEKNLVIRMVLSR